MADQKLERRPLLPIDLPEFKSLSTSSGDPSKLIATSDDPDEIQRIILQALQSNTLKSLDLPYHRFLGLLSKKNTQTKPIMEELETNTSVISVNLAGNYIHYDIIKAIAILLENADCSLKYLNFADSVVSDNKEFGYLRTQGLDIGFITILQALAKNNSLQYLNLAVNDLSSSETRKALIKALESNNSLIYLDFAGASAYPHDKNYLLLQSMETNNTLQYLNLTKTCDSLNTTKFANRIAKLLKTNKTLKGLNLSDNGLDIADIEVILNALEENYSILALDISKNKYSSSQRDKCVSALVRNLEFFRKQQQEQRDILANVLQVIQLPKVLGLLIGGYVMEDYSEDQSIKDIWSNPKEIVEWASTLSLDMKRKIQQYTLPYTSAPKIDDNYFTYKKPVGTPSEEKINHNKVTSPPIEEPIPVTLEMVRDTVKDLISINQVQFNSCSPAQAKIDANAVKQLAYLKNFADLRSWLSNYWSPERGELLNELLLLQMEDVSVKTIAKEVYDFLRQLPPAFQPETSIVKNPQSAATAPLTKVGMYSKTGRSPPASTSAPMTAANTEMLLLDEMKTELQAALKLLQKDVKTILSIDRLRDIEEIQEFYDSEGLADELKAMRLQMNLIPESLRGPAFDKAIQGLQRGLDYVDKLRGLVEKLHDLEGKKLRGLQ